MYDLVDTIYREYYHDLYRYLRQHVHSADMIEDIIQNTFLEALRSIEGFKGHSSMKTWIFGIAKYQMYRHFRKHKIKVNLDGLSEMELTTTPDFSDRVMAKQLLDTIDQLQPPHNEIMRLRLVDELSFKEIGLRVGRTENYCRVNFYRMKERLRKEYDHGNL